MSITYLIDDLHSEVSESELSETLNTTAFDTTTHATAGDLPEAENTGWLWTLVQYPQCLLSMRESLTVRRSSSHPCGVA
jgi:hypothetical protein